MVDLIPGVNHANDVDDKLVVDGSNGVGGEKLEVLKKVLNNLVIDVRNSGKEGGVLNEGVGADYVQKEKVLPSSFGSQDLGIRSAIFLFIKLNFDYQPFSKMLIIWFGSLA